MARGKPDEPRRPNALVAAAKRVSIGLGAAAQDKHNLKAQEWQGDAWVCFDEVPEVKHGILYAGNAMSKLRLFIATRPKDDPEGDPVPVDDRKAMAVPPGLAEAAKAELERLKSARGGQAELQRVMTMCLEVTGIGYLVGREARTKVDVDPSTGKPTTTVIPETWEVRSDREVEFKTEGDTRLALLRDVPKGPQETLDSERDTITAVWQRHAAWSGLADSNMRAAITDCRALQLLTGQVLAEAASAMPAQAWTIPNELTFSARPATTPPAEGEADPLDPLEQAIDEAFTEAVEDPTSMTTFRPFIIRGPAEYLKDEYLRLIDFKRGGGEGLEARIVARVNRLARGLNLPAEVVVGHAATTFANAEQIDQDTFEDYFQPRAEMLCDAFTTAFLHPNLVDSGVASDTATASAVFIWYDASRLIAQPDPEKNADGAHDRYAITDKTYRRVKGFSEDDAPTVDEVLTRVAQKRGIFTADLSKALLEILGVEIEVEALPQIAPGEEPTDAPAEPETDARVLQAVLAALVARANRGRVSAPIDATLASRRATPDYGRMMLAIDVALRNQLLGAAEATMTRALERAGNRMRNNPRTRDLVRTVKPRLVCAHLGPSLVADAGESTESLLDGAFDDLGEQFLAWGRNAQADALDLVGRVVGGFDTAERQALGLRQAEDLDEAWVWMERQMRALASARLFNPDPAAPDLGEFDPAARVPTGLVRQAVARAGGAAGITTDGAGSAFVTLTDGGTRPAGGIATGQLLMGELRDHGAMVEAYRWVYGPARRQRPFEPHQDLDGYVFENFDDEVLANPGSFPPFAFFLPGDHDGCACDVEPVVVPAEELD